MNIAVYGRSFHDSFISSIQEFFDEIGKRNAKLFIYEAFYSYLRPRVKISSPSELFSKHSEIAGKADVLISIGGDGSMLDTITLIRNSGIPLLGINTGRLGFLSNVSKNEIVQAIESLYQKKYTIEERVLLKVETEKKMFGTANFGLNELTLHRKDSGSMMTIHAYIDDNYLNSYWADGLIVSTPTGSTAYSLSCGGPIVVPGSGNFIITPIAPHNLNVRPVVVPDSSVIRLKVEGRSKSYFVSLDSRSETIEAESELVITKTDFKVKLIRLENQDFFTTIRNKLTWGIDKRN
ncbi:MAG: NAD kinase [Bacteroidota bacterium]